MEWIRAKHRSIGKLGFIRHRKSVLRRELEIQRLVMQDMDRAAL